MIRQQRKLLWRSGGCKRQGVGLLHQIADAPSTFCESARHALALTASREQRARALSARRSLKRTTPPVALPSVRARITALVKMSLLFQRDFGQGDPGPPTFKKEINPCASGLNQ
jgi:hypothetical protein